MPFFTPAGGGRGGYFEEGEADNTFASVSARDTYAAANAGWLAKYDANPRWFVRVGADPNYTLYVRRGSAWIALSQAVPGPRGLPGAKGDPGDDAAVNAANVLDAIDAFNAGQVTRARGYLSLTANNIAVELNAQAGEQGAVQLVYSALAGLPTIPDVTGLQDAAEVRTLIGTALAAAVTGNTEEGIEVTYDPDDGTFDFVVEGARSGTHTRYVAASADNAFTAAEFLGSSTTDQLTLPAFAENRYVAFAIPNDQPDLTTIRQQGGSLNQIGAFERVAGTLRIGGQPYKVWRSRNVLLPAVSGTTWTVS